MVPAYLFRTKVWLYRTHLGSLGVSSVAGASTLIALGLMTVEPESVESKQIRNELQN